MLTAHLQGQTVTKNLSLTDRPGTFNQFNTKDQHGPTKLMAQYRVKQKKPVKTCTQ